ncbi:ArnT family glycosyltransferase [Clostridium omnivorum]|uniref:Dolichyl-phosphate-mannose--protein mannosyltransferase n=1 Tax=Clostridium omnivorum TaxID=1604902 RepID=A0ABQ5N4E3_9CLOT|nr:glycosyltransferase family 39 protein [Clostridium sp. E14]GLC30093.1 dolichyl-phosphate-mannose--protein mannosyltransferase [Clostridium sp. E14]
MKKLKLTKENIALALITVLSAILNLGNLSIEGTANAYYAAAVKSMTVSFKNFFFVAFDPAGFVTIDKPPLGFWLQAISAKIFGYSGWSILLPQALAGVISVVLIYVIVKRSFGSAAGLISALCLAVTPVFVAVSRNNSVDNTLVMVLLLACLALSSAAEKGKFKYLILSLALVGVGFNVKMLQAYMIAPALYITYLLTTSVSFKKRIIHLAAGTAVLVAVSLSWALIVDSIPASSRPYVDSSTNNTVMELITGHNGIERLSLSSNSNNGGGGAPGGMPGGRNNDSNSSAAQNPNSNNSNSSEQNQANQGFPGNPPSGDGNTQGNPPSGMPGNPPSGDGQMGQRPDGDMQGGPMGGGSSGLQGTFGGETKSGITRLFSKNILSDQIVWFIPLAVLGFIAAAIKEKLNYKLDNKKKQALMLWFMWFLPVFIYFSFNTGTFHSYYLTMLAPAVAALTGIGLTSMWELYNEGGWKSWYLPVSLLANGAVQLLMQYYFVSTSSIIKVLMVLLIVLCFGSSIVLGISNLAKKNTNNNDKINQENNNNFKKIFVSLAMIGLLITPLVGSSTVLFTKLNGSFPAAGLELLSSVATQGAGQMGSNGPMDMAGNSNSKLIEYLQQNKTSSQKYLLVVSNANEAADIIVQTGEPVMAIGGFLGNDKSITLDQFKELVKKGEVRYVMTGGMKGGGSGNASNEIMNWVQQTGTLVSSSEYGVTNAATNQTNNNASSSNTQTNTSNTDSANAKTNNNNASQDNQRHDGFGGGNSGQLYDLKAYTDSLTK